LIGAKNEIYKLIDELAHSGVTVICISSELVEVLTLADRVIVMHEGRITAELPNHGLTQETIMQYATNQIQ
jgi:ABC-type sugar transport system ATPase subunit